MCSWNILRASGEAFDAPLRAHHLLRCSCSFIGLARMIVACSPPWRHSRPRSMLHFGQVPYPSPLFQFIADKESEWMMCDDESQSQSPVLFSASFARGYGVVHAFWREWDSHYGTSTFWNIVVSVRFYACLCVQSGTISKSVYQSTLDWRAKNVLSNLSEPKWVRSWCKETSVTFFTRVRSRRRRMGIPSCSSKTGCKATARRAPQIVIVLFSWTQASEQKWHPNWDGRLRLPRILETHLGHYLGARGGGEESSTAATAERKRLREQRGFDVVLVLERGRLPWQAFQEM